MHAFNKYLIFPFLLLLTTACAAQEEEFTSQPTKRNEYALVAYVSGGPGYYLSVAGVPEFLQPKIRKINPVGTVRLMWHPDHLIKVGVETGYMTFVSYSLRDSMGNRGRVRLDAVPVLVEWTMALTKRFNVFAGSGVYFLTTRLDYGEKSMANKLSIGWMAAVSYIHPLGKNTGLGAELKWLDAAESTDGTLALQVQLVWKFLRW
jgi:hypothetical protein